MNKEEHLINKTYFHTIVEEDSKKYPVKALGTAFFQEQLNEGSELSLIRFAQGEVYYHHKDMEAAVYKWANVKGELQPWASKNIGDAYYNLGWLNEAEKTYIGIQTDSTTLSIEVCLQLLTLYSEKDQPDKAKKYMEKALTINPDYPNVTDIARAFYEDRQEWKKAVELAVHEAARTKSLHWFTTLNGYIENDYINDFSPVYFEQVLLPLYEIDQQKFCKLVTSLSANFENGPSSLAWLKTMNDIFAKIDVTQDEPWQEITTIYYKSYLQLMNGQYLIHSLKGIIPDLLSTWLKLTKERTSLFPATAVLAWDDIFPQTLDSEMIKEAERYVLTRPDSLMKENEITLLLQTIMTWANENDVNVGNKQKWLLSQLEKYNHHYIFVTGNGASSLLNTIFEEDLLTDDPITAFVGPGEHPDMKKITDEETRSVIDMNELDNGDLIELTWPSLFLTKLEGTLVYASSKIKEKQEYAKIASGMLYVIGNKQLLIDGEDPLLNHWSEKYPGAPIHFVINNLENDSGSEKVKEILSEKYPSSRQFSVTSKSDLASLQPFIQTQFQSSVAQVNPDKASRLLYVARSMISHLLDQRMTKETIFKEKVTFNDQVRNKLKGLVNHLEDSKTEKSQDLLQTYIDLKEEMKRKVWEDIPPLLRTVADDLDEEADYRQVHEELEKSMNQKITHYINRDLVPAFESGVNRWMQESRAELTKTQNYLNEMSVAFNKMYEEDRMNLTCDFQVLKDWKRDLNRMMNRSEVQRINVMNRLIPSQLLLKSAGKLLGNMQKNKQVLYSQYQRYIKNSHFEHVSTEIIDQFFMEFDLFEKALKSDIRMSFEEPLVEVKERIEEAELEITQAKEKLETMKKHPDSFYDPLKIFEVRLLQCEMIDEMSVTTPTA
ncbi:tetratricopeptide repeat protein [Salipaludibacillus daqingensis]|uniref:tetratricopeptide repeat protein n=1 Tax=Salipaludibacillus daqingensis TaxID=3041001 RepID=UPI002474D6A7|nr:tetratricopeptide repeat protein [Salipaludibacillus daqingensis]